jgi:hypothetical protein
MPERAWKVTYSENDPAKEVRSEPTAPDVPLESDIGACPGFTRVAARTFADACSRHACFPEASMKDYDQIDVTEVDYGD